MLHRISVKAVLFCLVLSIYVPAANIYLSDMSEVSSTTGWSTLHYDKSIDGNTLTINGTTYTKGLGTHAVSTIVYDLNKAFTTFTSDVGVDDETQGKGSVQFLVYVDNTLVFDSGLMQGKAAAKKVNVSVSGKSTLKLVVNDGGDGFDYDHADWANAILVPVNSNYTIDNLKIACVGNSITQGDWLANASTQGYVALVQKMLGNKYRILNYGLSGRTMLSTSSSPYIKESKFRELFTVRPDIITIELGTNESRPSVWTTQAAYEADYSKFIDSLETIRDTNPAHPAHPLILPVFCTPCTDNNTYTISGTIIANQILPAVRKVAKAKGCPVIDAYTPFLPLMNLIWDGVHPDSNGNKVLADIYYENLQNLALKQSPPTRWLWYGCPPAGAPGALGNNDVDKPMLYMFPAPDSIRNGAAVLICPGGGYTGLPGIMGYEGMDEAKWFNTFGVSAFVLRYRLSPYHHPIELNDTKRAMRIIRYYAADYGIDTTRIGIMGFSAGGHLASTLGTHFDSGKPDASDPIERKKSRPDFLALIYPVITLSGQYAHTGSRDALLGVPANTVLVDSLSNQKWVTSQTPQTFLAHGDADLLVPIQNSRMFDSACKAFNVPDTLVVEPGKDHGFGMAGIWPDALKNWMLKRGLLTKPPVETEKFQTKKQPIENMISLQYSPARGIYIAHSKIHPDIVDIFSMNGICLASYTGAVAKAFSWKPQTRGIYIVKIRAGNSVIAAKINCSY